MSNVKFENSKPLSLTSHVFCYFFWNNFSMLISPYLGASSFVFTTLMLLIIAKIPGKKILKKIKIICNSSIT